MEKKTIIWHTPQKKPEEWRKIIFYAGTDNVLCIGAYINKSFRDDPNSEYFIDWLPEEVHSWAYLSELLKTSKALDVAIQHIQAYKSDHLNGRMEGCCLYSDETPFDDVLNEISEIIGGK